MDFWLIDPCGCQPARRGRGPNRITGLANHLQSAGHGVTLWTVAGTKPRSAAVGLEMKAIREFDSSQPVITPPAAILVSLASLATAEVAVRHAQAHRVPLVIDLPSTVVPRTACHQLSASWPVVGGWLRASHAALCAVFEAASGLVGLSPACVDAFRPLLPPRLIARLVTLPAPALASCAGELDLESARATLAHLGVDFRRTIGLVAGDFTSPRAASAIGQAAFLLNHRPELQFVVAGDPDQLEPIRRVAHAARNMVLPEQVDEVQWAALLRSAQFGVLAGNSSFVREQPATMADFAAAGLAIVGPRDSLYGNEIVSHQLGNVYWDHDASDLARAIVRTAGNAGRLASHRSSVEAHAKASNFQRGAKAAAELLVRVATASGGSVRRAA